MRLSRTLRAYLLALASAVLFIPLSGCGSDLPETGTAATPVNLDQAAKQNKAMQDAYKSKMPASRTRK